MGIKRPILNHSKTDWNTDRQYISLVVLCCISRVSCQKGPYLPCVSMAGRTRLAGYHRYLLFAAKICHFDKIFISVYTGSSLVWNAVIVAKLFITGCTWQLPVQPMLTMSSKWYVTMFRELKAGIISGESSRIKNYRLKKMRDSATTRNDNLMALKNPSSHTLQLTPTPTKCSRCFWSQLSKYDEDIDILTFEKAFLHCRNFTIISTMLFIKWRRRLT